MIKNGVRSVKSKPDASLLPIYLFLFTGALVVIGPFIWGLLTSFKTLNESLLFPPSILPNNWVTENYKTVWNSLPFASFFFNTFAMIGVRVITVTVFSSMAGYAFARIDFKGKGFLFLLVLMPMMIPGQIYILPQYLLVSKIGWTDTVKALILPGIASAFGTFLTRQFFMSVPTELEEAAILDGCNTGQVFSLVMLPLAKSSLVSLGIFTSLFAWKDLMWPLVVNISSTKMPLSSGLSLLQGQFVTNYPQLMAGSAIATIPMIIIFILFQKQFVEGIATSGSKN